MGDKGSNTSKFRKILRFIFGSYTLPGFVLALFNLFKSGKVSRGLKKILLLPINFLKKKPFLGILFVLVIVAAFGGKFAWNLWQSSQPQPIYLSYRVQEPAKNDYVKKKSFPIELSFNGSAAKLEELEKSPASPIVISPEIKGTWLWSKDNKLTFTPDELWSIGETYNVELSPELFPEHVKVDDLKFNFKIDSFNANFSSSEFYIDPEDSKIKRALAQIRFNYPVDPATLVDKIEIKPNLKASSGSLKNEVIKFKVSYSEDKLTAFIVSDPLGMPAKTVSLDIKLEKGVKSSYGGNPTDNSTYTSVSIPGASNFVRVNNIKFTLVKNKEQEYEQVIVIDTKGEVNPKELLNNIEAWVLPKDRPELPGIRFNKNHHWRRIDEMVPDVLKLATKVKLTHIPNEREVSSINSLKFDVTPNKYVYFKLKEGTRFYGDYFLSEDYKTIQKIREYPKEVSILSEGSLLAMTGEKRVPIMARGIDSVNVEIARVRPDDLNHLVSQSNGRIDNLNFTNYNFNENNISKKYSKTLWLDGANNKKKPIFSSFSLSDYLNTIPEDNLRYGLFLIKLQESGYSSRRVTDKRLVMVTDLGFLVKTNTNRTRDIFVQSIATGLPVNQATVEVWGKNGNPIFSGTTGTGGKITIPSLDSYRNEKYPTVFVVKKGNDLSFMALKDSGQRLNYSGFDIGGVHGSQDPKKLNAFIFSDRGIYRPGDKFNIAAIIKAGDWNINLAGTPLEVAITDPKGAEVYTDYIKLDGSGFEEINYQTQDYSPTGYYTTTLYVIKSGKYRHFLGSTKVKVEEFLPDTLKVNTTFKPSASSGWVSPKDLKGIVSAKNLFGTPAIGNSVQLQLTLSPGYQKFWKYKDYKFFDPYLKNRRYEEYLGNYTTDSDGKVQANISLKKFEEATYSVKLYAEVFEKASGRNVSSQASILVSPAQYLIGYKADGSLNHIKKNGVRNLNFIAVDSKLNKVPVSGIKFVLSETRYISSLVKQPNGVYKYQSKKKLYKVNESSLNITNDGANIKLPTNVGGDFTWEIIDTEDNVLTSGAFTVIGEKNIERSLDRTAELEISLNKTDFKPGEEIEVFIKGPYKGAGLITIERDKVYTHKWFKSNGESTTATITVPNNLEGNGYVSVTLVRALDSKEIYMSPLSYGVSAFSVSKESRMNKINLDIPVDVRPGDVLPITYNTSSPGKIVIFAVDMGILQVAKYKTPDPIGYFFKKRALEVSTSQILDLILPEYSIAQSLSAMGGGGGEEYLKNNLNPFKRKTNIPVAYWSGILDSDNKKRTVEYKVPDYFNGTLKIMAVAVSDSRLGSTSKDSVIRSPFVIQPNVPTLAAPGDEMNISVTVSNVKSGSGDNVPVKLTAKPSKHFKIVNEATQEHKINEGLDKTYTFKIIATGEVGAATIEFIATGANEEVKISSYLSVRPPMPFQTFVDTGVVKKNSKTVDIQRKSYNEFATREVSASYLPVGMALGLNTYLSNYAYGCTEQITSMAFPKLFPSLIKNIEMDQETLSRDIQSTISILQSRQKTNGGFGIWTSLSDNYGVVDSHAMLFLTKAKEAGYFVPKSLFDSGIKQLTSIAKSGNNSVYSLTQRAFAIYLLTLNEIVTTSYIESLEVDLNENYKKWKSSYAGLYLAGSYALMQQSAKANSILNAVGKDLDKTTKWNYYDELSYASLYLYILSAHSPGRLKTVSEDTLLKMADQMSKRRFSTYSASLALMAIDSFLKSAPTVEGGPYEVLEIVGDSETKINLTGKDIARGSYSSKADKIKVDGQSNINLFYQVTDAGFSLEAPTESHNGIEITRRYLDAKGNESNEFSLGDDVQVRLRFRSTSGKEVNNVAIVDMIPAGFEMDIESVRKNDSIFKSEYIDIREDRVVLYGKLTGSAIEFTYKLRAVNSGKFKVPPSYGESMYDQEIWSIKPMNDITILDLK